MARVSLASTTEGVILVVKAGVLLPAAGAATHVYQHGTTTPVPVYVAETGSSELTQPLTASSTGQLPGWVEPGQRLTLAVTFAGSEQTQSVEVQVGNETVLERERAETAEAALTSGVAAEVGARTAAVSAAITTAEAASDTAGTAAADVATEKTRALAAEAAISTEAIGTDPTTKAPAVGGGSVPLLSSVVSGSSVLGDSVEGAPTVTVGVSPASKVAFPLTSPYFTLRRSLQANLTDVHVVVLGDSTCLQQVPWPVVLATGLGAMFPAFSVTYHKWNDGASNFDTPSGGLGVSSSSSCVIQTGSGANTLHLWNFSYSGKSIQYYQGALWADLLSAISGASAVTAPVLTFISQGHNEPAGLDQFGSRLTGLAEFVRAQFPQSGLVLLSENNKTTGTDNLSRSMEVQWLAAERGYGFVNLTDIFLGFNTSPAPGSSEVRGMSYYLGSDGIHPTSADFVGSTPVTSTPAPAEQITFYGNPTGGTFTPALGGIAVAAPLAYNTSLSTVQTALAAIAGIGAGNVTVTGTPGVKYIVTTSGPALGKLLTVTSALTGGTNPFASHIALDGNGERYGMSFVSEAIADQFRASFGATRPQASPKSAFLTPTENYLVDPMFATWDGVSAFADGWTFSGSGVASKDVTHFETGSFGVKLTCGGSNVYFYKDVNPALLGVLPGQYVTLAVRIFVPSGQAQTGVGRIGVDSTTGGGALVQSNTIEGQGAFRWAVQRYKVTSAPARLRLLIYVADGSAAEGGTITIDRVAVCRGMYPADVRLLDPAAQTVTNNITTNSVATHWLNGINPSIVRNSDHLGIPIANQALLWMCPQAVTISKVRLEVTTQSGNIALAVYRSNGSTGVLNKPSGSPAISTGSIACPAVGVNNISLGGSVTINAGDWIALSADSATAQFRSELSAYGTDTMGEGSLWEQTGMFPLTSAVTAGSLVGAIGAGILLIGVT